MRTGKKGKTGYRFYLDPFFGLSEDEFKITTTVLQKLEQNMQTMQKEL